MPTMSTPERPKLPTDIRPGEGVADPRYLLAEVTELRDIADQAGADSDASRPPVPI
jgi:hypothetical protein